MPSRSLLAARDHLSHYVVERAVGIGRRARTYQGYHKTLRYPVLIKVLTEETEAEQAREVSVLRRLRGESAPELLSVGRISGQGGGHQYLVMDFLPGDLLSRLLQIHRRFDAERVVHIGVQLLTTLERLHELGYAHCDVKPDNVMVAQEFTGMDRVSLLDFGAVVPLHGSEDWSSGIYGTPPYVAPELMRDAPPSPLSDIYGVAAVLYECATGIRCPRSDSGVPPPPARKLVPLDDQLSALIHRGLHPDPKCRFQSAREFAEALAALSFDEIIEVGLEGTFAGTSQETLDTLRLQEARAPAPREALRSVPWYGDSAMLLSTHQPIIWALGGDPGTDRSVVRQALDSLRSQFQIEVLDRETCERKRVEFMSGAQPPNVLVFGDLHVLLGESLLAEVARQGETSCLLISTHENAELLHNTVNACSLHGQLCLPAAAEAIQGEIVRMVERAARLRRRYDGLRLALKDAQEDLDRLRERLQRPSVSPPPPPGNVGLG